MTTSPCFTVTPYAIAGGSMLGPFSTVWTYEQASDVTVYICTPSLGAVLLASGGQYNLTGGSPLSIGGNVTLQPAVLATYSTVVAGTWDPGVALVLVRATSEDQPSALGDMAVFSPSVYEAALDHLSRQAQDLATDATQAIRLPIGNAPPVLPPAAARAGKLLGFDTTLQALPTLVDATFTVDEATLSFATVATAANAAIPPGTAFLQVMGYYAAGDCPTAVYVPAGAGAALGKFQSADGQWWTLAPVSEGWVDWFGAQKNNPAYDNTAALAASLAYFPVSRLSGADYWIAATWKINTPWRALIGVGPNAGGGTPVSRIVTANPAVDIIQVGPDAQPGSIGQFLQGVTLQQITISRSVAPNLPPGTGGDIRNGVSGLRVQYCLGCYFTNLWINENINAVFVRGNVANYYQGLHLGRTLAGAGGGGGADRYYGVFVDGTAALGLAGGNASVYFSYISSACANVAINSHTYAYGGFTDTYWSYLESSGHASGMMLNGTTNVDAGAPTEDIHIHHAIFDGLSGYGIYINQGNAGTNITIDQCYFEGSQYGVFVTGTFGATSIVGCQFDNLAVGVYALSSLGVTDSNCNFTDCETCVQWEDSNSCESAGSILSYKSGTAHGSGAVILISAARCVWRSKITGPADSVPSGAVVLTIDGVTHHACDYNEINCSGIDPGALTGGSANKLVMGGTQIVATGIAAGAPAGMTHNVVYGVMN